MERPEIKMERVIEENVLYREKDVGRRGFGWGCRVGEVDTSWLAEIRRNQNMPIFRDLHPHFIAKRPVSHWRVIFFKTFRYHSPLRNSIRGTLSFIGLELKYYTEINKHRVT